jgi:hypothetical protein
VRAYYYTASGAGIMYQDDDQVGVASIGPSIVSEPKGRRRRKRKDFAQQPRGIHLGGGSRCHDR